MKEMVVLKKGDSRKLVQFNEEPMKDIDTGGAGGGAYSSLIKAGMNMETPDKVAP